MISDVDLAALLDQLSHAPHLDGARCRKHPRVWDGATASDAAFAAYICVHECGCFERCREYLHASPFPISGIVAGELIRSTRRRGDGAADWVAAELAAATRQRRQPPPAPKRAAAIDWLRRFLEPGPARSDDILAAAEVAGIPRHQLFRACQQLGIRKHQRGRHTMWRMP